MKNIIYTIIDFIRLNLPSINFHVVRNSPLDSASVLLREESINLTVLSTVFTKHGTDINFEIDVIFADENTCVQVVDSLSDITQASLYTILRDYTNLSSPVDTKKLIYWEPLTFRRIFTDRNCRFNSTFKVTCYERY